MMLPNSLSLFKVLVNSPTMTEKRLMIDLADVRNAYEKSSIYFIGWIPTTLNIANGLTKLGLCPILERILNTQQLDVEVTTIIDRRFGHLPLNRRS